MKILVTGGAGFIGSHLVEKLIQRGNEVVILDDLSTGNLCYIRGLINHSGCKFIKGSVLNRKLLAEAISGCEVVFHLAAVLGVKNTVEDPLKVIEGNIDGTRNVLELGFSQRVKVIFASTSEVYGKNERLPYHEESDRILGATTKHRWCYATAKALDEHMCLAYADKGLPVTIVRFFNAYGPRATATQYGGVIPKFVTAAIRNNPITIYGTGEQTRCFTYIDDAVEGTVQCIDPVHNGQVYNIGIDQQISINDLAKKIRQLCHSSSLVIHMPYEEAYGKGYEDTPNRVPDLSKSIYFLKYNPKITIEEGLIKTIAWYKNEEDSRPSDSL